MIRYWLLAVGVVIVLCLRIGEWKKIENNVESNGPFVVGVRLRQPVVLHDYGCSLNWKKWTIIIDSASCDSSNLVSLSAGDFLHLELLSDEQTVAYAQLRGSLISFDRVLIRPVVSIYWWERQIWKLRNRVVLLFKQILPFREAGLVVGILLGVKGALSDDFYNALLITGTLHVVAASGYNISVVAKIVMQTLLHFFGRRVSGTVTLVLVWVYVSLSGGDPPIVRAGIMGSLVLLSSIIGREAWILLGYLSSGITMVLVWPWLLSSVSFQLSMAATAGVIWGTAWLERLFNSISGSIKGYSVLVVVWQNFLTTVSATIAVSPVLLIHFGQVSLLGLLVNPLVLGLVPLIMYLSILISLLGFIWFPLAQLLGWLLLPITKIWIDTVMFFGRFEADTVNMSINWWWAWGWWLMWGGIILISYKKKSAS